MNYWHWECKTKSKGRVVVIGAILLFVIGIGLIIVGVVG